MPQEQAIKLQSALTNVPFPIAATVVVDFVVDVVVISSGRGGDGGGTGSGSSGLVVMAVPTW